MSKSVDDELRMDAYYYSFNRTGVIEIDRVLSAVATAGKMHHNTEDWQEDVVGAIQKAANDAAQLFTKQLEEAKDINGGHWYMDDRYDAPYIAHCSCGYASGSVDVIKGHVAWKLATLTQDTKGGTDDTPRV